MALSAIDLIRLTIRSLRSNPMRSALSMLGVFMGVTATSAALQVGSISQSVIAQELAKRDAPAISLYPQWQPDMPFVPLKSEDLIFLRQRLVKIQAISAVDWAGPRVTLFRDRIVKPSVMAVSQEFPSTSGRSLSAGRFFTAADFDNYRSVTVIDQFTADELFNESGTHPVGQTIYISYRPYVVVGVMQTKVESNEPPKGQALIPMSLYQSLTGRKGIGSIHIRPYHLEDIERIDEQAQTLLSQRFPNRQFWSWNNVEDIRERQQILQLASGALAIVGATCLLVGGVGIANIMIASVAERTAEIGLRRAVGATQREIMMQFILESMLLSLVGGVAAIAFVHVLTQVVATKFELPYQFELQNTTIAISSALLVGVGASLFPAIQASQLDPVRALQSQ